MTSWIPVWVLDALMAVLDFLHAFVGDYGWAIVLLTVIMRLLMMPLTIKQTRSMHDMQRIQPMIKDIQKKHKDNKQKQQEEMMKLYEEHKVNPLGGCLPILLQMPVFIALFQVLRVNFVDAIAALPLAEQAAAKAWTFFGWNILADLTATPKAVYDASGIWAVVPYAIFVLLFGLSAWLPQKMLSQDKQQSRIGLYMSVMLLYFGWVSPAGVLVYWVTSSVWQIGQQAVTLRMVAREEGAG